MPKMQNPGNGMEYPDAPPETTVSCPNQPWGMLDAHAKHDIS